MKRLRAQEETKSDAKGAAIALGNFDGVHRGHQAVIESAHAVARERGAPLGVAMFAPHPRTVFHPDAPPFRLQSDEQRARALEACGVKALYEIGFDRALSCLTDAEFAERVLARRLGVTHVSVGADFRFGKGRMGDAESLERLGRDLGFTVAAIAPVGGAKKISSSAIRAAIGAGDMSRAEAGLTRPWAIEGAVQRGFGRGRGFGFATANIRLNGYVRPRLGVYAVRAQVRGEWREGVASIGVNPTVGALSEPLLEAHFFGVADDLYGEPLDVEIIAFLRDEATFDDVEMLKLQMARDADVAREILAKRA